MEAQFKKEYTYFQYYKEFNLPIFIKLSLGEFELGIVEFLNEICFTKLSNEENKKIVDEIDKNPKSKVLRFTEATPLIAKNINFFPEGDMFGLESVFEKSYFRIYRYKKIAIQVFSSAAKEWELGCYNDFGVGENQFAYVTVINRFLSWAMASNGIIGFWGVPVDEGVVIMNHKESKGEAVFLDIYKNVVYTLDGVKKLDINFLILRLDNILRGRKIQMKSSELLSFLAVHCCYFDTKGLSVPIRQMIRRISVNIKGLIYPRENFKPRTDLSI
jgi:hypothetical protein